MHSFNHYTSVHVKIMHIDAKLWLWEHFEKSVKRIILQCLSQELKKVRHMSRPAEKGETYVSPSWDTSHEAETHVSPSW